jgi:ferritin
VSTAPKLKILKVLNTHIFYNLDKGFFYLKEVFYKFSKNSLKMLNKYLNVEKIQNVQKNAKKMFGRFNLHNCLIMKELY